MVQIVSIWIPGLPTQVPCRKGKKILPTMWQVAGVLDNTRHIWVVKQSPLLCILALPNNGIVHLPTKLCPMIYYIHYIAQTVVFD